MKRVDLKLCFRCNNNCRFCIQADKKGKPDKSPEEVRSILKKESEECDGVVFTGGEPTIYEDFLEYVELADELGYEYIHIQSNGRKFADKDYCEKIIEAGANVFNPALHGSKPEIHDELTRRPGSFEETLQGIKNLKELGQDVLVNTVITKINYRDLPEVAKLMTELRPNKFQFAFIHISPVIKDSPRLIEKLVPRYFQVDPYVKRGLEIANKAGVAMETEAIPFCFMENYKSHISEVTCPETNVYDADTTIDNFNKVRKNKAKAKGPECKKCKYDDVCEGVWKEYPNVFGWDEFEPITS